MSKRYSTAHPRLLYPALATSRKVASCSSESQLLFTRLVVAADDQGRLQGDPALIKAQCMPLIPKATRVALTRWLAELEGQGLITCYEAAGEPLIQIRGWWDHQAGQRWVYPSRWQPPAGWEDAEPRVASSGAPPSAGMEPSSRRHDAGMTQAGGEEVQDKGSGEIRNTPTVSLAPMRNNLYQAYTDLTESPCDTKASQWIDDLVKQFDRGTVRHTMYHVSDPHTNLLGKVTHVLRSGGGNAA